jgi:thiamine-phosphate pyrophosphorylase
VIAPPSRLNVICDADACSRAGWSLVDVADACLQGGATFLQLRAKQLSGAAFLSAAAAVVGRAPHALVTVNDRADIARLAGAGGVHVGQDDLPPRAVRRIVGDAAWVGLSTHTAQQLEAAVLEPVSYVAIGPVYATATKETRYLAIGLARVRAAAAVAHAHGLPLAAIGGITLDRAPEVIGAGADAVAVIGDLLAGGNPERRVREYLSALA